MNEIPYSSDMIFDFFGKRQSLSGQSRNSLPHCIVESFYMVCFSALLFYSAMSLGWKNICISRPKIRITNSALTINRRKRIPQPLRAFIAAASAIYPGNFFCLYILRKPNPYLISFVPDKGPCLISLNRQPAFTLLSHFHFLEDSFIFLVDITLQPSFRHSCNSCYSCKRNPFQKKFVYYFLRFTIDNFIFRIFNKLPPAILTHKFLLPVMNITIFNNLSRIALRANQHNHLLISFPSHISYYLKKTNTIYHYLFMTTQIIVSVDHSITC